MGTLYDPIKAHADLSMRVLALEDQVADLQNLTEKLIDKVLDQDKKLSIVCEILEKLVP